MNDLEREELAVHRALSAAAPVAPPIGFRDAVMRRVRADEPQALWEWIVAIALAVPSLAYLGWELAANGADFLDGIDNAFLAAQGAQVQQLSFFVDGLVVLAVALLGIASVVAAHASLAVRPGGAGAKPPREAGITFTGAKLP